MDEIHKYITLARKQRHDFMNVTQVVYGYIQIGKVKEAEAYLEKFCKRNDLLNELYKLGDEYFAFCLQEVLNTLWLKGFDIDLNVEIVSFRKNFFQSEYYKKFCLVNNIFKEFENSNSLNIFVYIFEDEMGQSLLICNDEEIIEQSSFLNKWENISSDIKDFTIHRCCYGNDLAYRITFKE